MNANEILKIVRGLRVAMSLADAVPTEAHKHEGDLKWFGEVVNVHGGYDAIRDALEAARAAAVATDPVGILLKLCDQLETMKHLMVLHPSGGQNYPYLDRDNVCAYVEQARAAVSKSDANLPEDERATWSFKQWWEHVGAWETPEGFVSFGSPMAVRAMLIQFGRVVEARAALSSAPMAQAEPRPTDDELWEQTLRERDTYHEWADKLADAIATYFAVDIGEHSNQNCPWAEALEAIEAATPAVPAAPSEREPDPLALYEAIRSKKYTTVAQSWELVELVTAAMSAAPAAPIEREGE